jgi:hypothetical protein|tara:strand:- start:112 stop:501 length:390 start_codon:yes stop_codon:yes gene_type:complete
MNKLLLILTLTIISSNVLADWTLVQTGKESDEYVDSATIRISGNLAKMWSLTNISKNIKNIKPGEKAFAVKTVREYDCKEHKSRALFVAWYNDYMGTGGIERSSESPDAKWKEVTPGIRESCWKIACGK